MKRKLTTSDIVYEIEKESFQWISIGNDKESIKFCIDGLPSGKTIMHLIKTDLIKLQGDEH